MSKKNTTVTLDNPLTGKIITVAYRSGIRLFQFMSDNHLTEEDNSRALLTEAKAQVAKAAFTEIAADKQSKVLSYSEGVVLKGNTFYVRGKMTVDRGEATEAHVELIREWSNKKALSSQKALEKANTALQTLTGQDASKLKAA